MKQFELFDAVRIVRLPDGRSEISPYHSQTGTRQIKPGDIGVVIGHWPNNKYRVEAVRADDAIDWQDHFFVEEHLEVVPPTAAQFSRRRINEHWANLLSLGQELSDVKKREAALKFARKVMAFARRNVDQIIERLKDSAYLFANAHGPWQAPDESIADMVEELAKRGVYVPVALQAWLMEVGSVDLTGTHPAWSRSAYMGMSDDGSDREPWYTDALVIWFEARQLLERFEKGNIPARKGWLDIAPDAVTKANISGLGPISMNCEVPLFDTFLAGQRGSLTLLSYLRLAFEWGGFPGFDYIPDAPKDMLKDLGRGLTRL